MKINKVTIFVCERASTVAVLTVTALSMIIEHLTVVLLVLTEIKNDGIFYFLILLGRIAL